MTAEPLRIEFVLSPDQVDVIVRRVLEVLRDRPVEQSSSCSPFLTIPEAAAFIGKTGAHDADPRARKRARQRIDDLLSEGQLTRFKDGRRTLVRRIDLENYVHRTRP